MRRNISWLGLTLGFRVQGGRAWWTMHRVAGTLHSVAALNTTSRYVAGFTLRRSAALSSKRHGLPKPLPRVFFPSHLIRSTATRSISVSPAVGRQCSRGLSTTMKKREDTRYGEEEYWEKRYSEEAFMTFDWYQYYADLVPILKKHIPKSGRVMMAGCGNAVMTEDMVKDGYQNIVNVDYSPTLIKVLEMKYKNMPQISNVAMDVRNMSEFEDESFDAAIDKGLWDAMICAPNGAADITQMIKEMHRVLKPGGTFVVVTYGFPLVRMPAFMETGKSWSTNLWILPKPYCGKTLSKYPDPIPMEIKNWINTRKEDYETGVIFVYVATKM